MKFCQFFVLCCLVGCLSCKKDSPELVFDNVQISTPDNKIVRIAIPKAIGTTTKDSLVNATLKATIVNLLFSEKDTIATDSKLDYNDAITHFNTAYSDFKNDFPEATGAWFYDIDGELSYSSKAIISIRLTSYTYTGGAHGNTYIQFLNFNQETGKLLLNSDLITDTIAFSKQVEPVFRQTIKTNEISLFNPKDFKLPKELGYSNSGVVFIYNAYEIAPYSDGRVEFNISFDQLEPYLKYD